MRKLQESKLPVYQVFAGGNLPKSTESSESKRSPKKDSEGGHSYNVRKAQAYAQNQQAKDYLHQNITKMFTVRSKLPMKTGKYTTLGKTMEMGN